MVTYRKLVRWFFRWTWFFPALAAGGLALCELLGLIAQMNGEGALYLPYESVMERGGFHVMFLLALLFAVFVPAMWSGRFYRRSPRAIYTMLCLPGPRWTAPAALATVGGAYALALVAVQDLLAVVLYPVFTAQSQMQLERLAERAVGSLPPGGFPDGLYLAFARSPLLHLTLPATGYGLLCLLMLVLVCAVSCLLRRGIAFLSIPAAMELTSPFFRGADSEFEQWVWPAVFLILSGILLYNTVRKMKLGGDLP